MCIGHCCWLAVAVLTNSQSEDCDDKGIRYRTYRMMVVVLVFRSVMLAAVQLSSNQRALVRRTPAIVPRFQTDDTTHV